MQLPILKRATETYTSPDYPRTAWYAIAWDTDFKAELLARTVCNKPLVMYRTREGRPVVLEDACWHRLLPLSKGRLECDNLVCGYHGLAYDATGRCTYMPSQETINPSACIRSYPAVERHRFIWAWMGDPAKADPARVPDMHWNDDPLWVGDGETIHVHCNYKLVLDNLMDLTHETFVNGSSLGQWEVAEAPFEVTHGPAHATVTRSMKDVLPPPFWSMQLGKVVPCDRWQIIQFECPATIAIDVGVAPTSTGAPEGNRSQGVNGYVLNTVTPETDGTCHYFWSFCRNYRLREQGLTTRLRQGVHNVFAEDERILEAQQKAFDLNLGRTFYNLNIDSGAMWMGKLIDEAVAREVLQAEPVEARNVEAFA